jgi:hypothetical protein
MAKSNGKNRQQRQILKVLNRVVAIASFATIIALMIYLIINAFAIGFGIGLRVLAAGILPPIAITYISFFTNLLSAPRRDTLPRINLYIISMLWTTFLLGLFANVVDPENWLALTLGELLFSLTLVLLVMLYQMQQYITALAASYGVVSGLLIFTMF